MLAWVSMKLEERRSNAAVLSMIDGLLSVADDWVRARDFERYGVDRVRLISSSLSVTIEWEEPLHFGTAASNHKLFLEGNPQPLPRAIWGKVDKLIAQTRKRIERAEADAARVQTESKLAHWVVANHRTLRRIELAAE